MSAQQVWEDESEPDAKVLTWRRHFVGYPENVTYPHLHRLFTEHPELRGIRAAALVDSLYDAVVMNA